MTILSWSWGSRSNSLVQFPLTATLHAQHPPTSNNPLLFPRERVWEQNPTPPRSSQEYIALLRLKKRGGEGESKRKTWQVRTQGKSERPLRKVETSQQLQEEERWERKNRWRNEEHEETMPGGWEKWRETERNWWLPEPPTVPTANEESRTNPSLPSFTEP